MNSRTFIIAEAGVNHNGDIEIARKLIDGAVLAGADAVKFQTFKSELLATRRAERCAYQSDFGELEDNQLSMLKKLEFTNQQFVTLKEYSDNVGIEFMSTGFDVASLEFLVENKLIKRIKIPSGELVNPFLLLAAAKSDLPIILSTGLSSLEEIKVALAIISYGASKNTHFPTKHQISDLVSSCDFSKTLSEKVSILHCTSEYPAPIDDTNLLAIDTLRSEFGLTVGISDHSSGDVVSLAAVARGASIVEKHFTTKKSLPGPDHSASLNIEELQILINNIRLIERSLGSGAKEPATSELQNKSAIRGSLVARKKIATGEILNEQNVTVKRPGDGLNPTQMLELYGSKAIKNYDVDEQI